MWGELFMARRVPITGKILILVTALLFRSLPLADAQEMEVIAGGELEYQNHCAVCHGVDGKGQGIMSKYLTVRPADLTQIAQKNGGIFRFWQVYRTIDGREAVRGHGTRDMPVWGDRFRAQAGGNDSGSRAQAAGRLLGLVFYLQHIQE
jgi:mono/diheme cytochrome c family protein